MTNKKQIIFIRGGEAFDSKEDYYKFLKLREYDPYDHHKSWRDWVEWALSEEFEMLVPNMPNKQNADYLSWKIWFEKLLPYLTDKEPIVIGNSLGCAFLLKYLSEENFPSKISQLHLVSTPIKSVGLSIESLGDFKFDLEKLGKVEDLCKVIYIYHSEDDPVVPFEHALILSKHLPKAHLEKFKNRAHFLQPAFIELLNNIYKELGKK